MLDRRRFLQALAALGLLAGAPARAQVNAKAVPQAPPPRTAIWFNAMPFRKQLPPGRVPGPARVSETKSKAINGWNKPNGADLTFATHLAAHA